jgi:hypothetical protein
MEEDTMKDKNQEKANEVNEYAGEGKPAYPGEPPTRFINGYYVRGISPAELAHHNRRPSPVTGSAFKHDPDPRIVREPQQTQETTQADVDYITEWLEKL